MWFESESESLEKKVMDLLNTDNGMTDIEIGERLQCTAQIAGIVCRQLEYKRIIERRRVKGQPLGNYIIK